MRWRIPLRSRRRVSVRLAPLEPLGGKLVRRQAARPRREAARDDDRLFPVPSLVVCHDSGNVVQHNTGGGGSQLVHGRSRMTNEGGNGIH